MSPKEERLEIHKGLRKDQLRVSATRLTRREREYGGGSDEDGSDNDSDKDNMVELEKEKEEKGDMKEG